MIVVRYFRTVHLQASLGLCGWKSNLFAIVFGVKWHQLKFWHMIINWRVKAVLTALAALLAFWYLELLVYGTFAGDCFLFDWCCVHCVLDDLRKTASVLIDLSFSIWSFCATSIVKWLGIFSLSTGWHYLILTHVHLRLRSLNLLGWCTSWSFGVVDLHISRWAHHSNAIGLPFKVLTAPYLASFFKWLVEHTLSIEFMLSIMPVGVWIR